MLPGAKLKPVMSEHRSLKNVTDRQVRTGDALADQETFLSHLNFACQHEALEKVNVEKALFIEKRVR